MPCCSLKNTESFKHPTISKNKTPHRSHVQTSSICAVYITSLELSIMAVSWEPECIYRYCMCSDGTIFHKTFESSPIGLWIWFGNMYRNVSDVLFIIHCTRGQCKPLDFHLLFKVLMSFAIQSCELQWYYSLVDVFTIPRFFNWIWPALFDQYRTYRTLLSLLLQYLFIVRLYIVN